MKEKTKFYKYFYNILILFCGFVGLWLFLSHMLHFSFPDYFYANNPDIKFYYGTNVVSMWADLSFFTYHTLIFFSLWCIGFAISNFFNFKKLHSFLTNAYVMSFVFTNYVVTAVLYTFFELTSGNITFGLYANVPFAYHNLGTNIITHYIYFIFALILFLKINSSESKNKILCYFPICYLIVYYIIVKMTGKFSYIIEWYPYVIFDAKSFGKMFGITNYFWTVVVLILALIIIGFIYMIMFKFFAKYKTKKSNIDT